MTSVESGEYAGSEEEGNQQAGGSRTASAVLRFLGVELTQFPDRVVVQEVAEGDKRVRLTLLVDKADMGRVIGRQGKIAGAIRAVVRAAGAKDGIDAAVEIQERD